MWDQYNDTQEDKSNIYFYVLFNIYSYIYYCQLIGLVLEFFPNIKSGTTCWMKTVGCTAENKRGENMIIQVCRSICVIFGSSFFSPLSKPNGTKETQKNRSGSVQLVGPINPAPPSNSRRIDDDGNEVGRAKISRYISLGLAGVHWAELWRCPSQGLISIAVFCWFLLGQSTD